MAKIQHCAPKNAKSVYISCLSSPKPLSNSCHFFSFLLFIYLIFFSLSLSLLHHSSPSESSSDAPNTFLPFARLWPRFSYREFLYKKIIGNQSVYRERNAQEKSTHREGRLQSSIGVGGGFLFFKRERGKEKAVREQIVVEEFSLPFSARSNSGARARRVCLCVIFKIQPTPVSSCVLIADGPED